MEIYKEFRFEAAHRLPLAPEGHRCRRLHGHSFLCRVVVAGPMTAQGWVMDFADLKTAMAPLLDVLDHSYLNEVPGLENPTAEMLAHWILERLSPRLPGLSAVEIAETCSAGCVLRTPPHKPISRSE